MNVVRCPVCNSNETRLYKSITREYRSVPYALDVRKCNECGLVFLGALPDISYDESYLVLEGVVTLENEFSQFHAKERMAAITGVVSPPDKNFLDIGIGDGLVLSVAESSGYDTFGLDVNPDGVARARKHYKLRANVSLEPFERAFEGVTFDIIHMNEVIEHVTEPMALLRWCRTKLKKEGRIVVQTGNIDSFVARLKGDNWDYIRPVHAIYFSSRTLGTALSRAGFIVESVRTIDWRFTSAIRHARHLFKKHSWRISVKFLLLYFSAIFPGVRRTTLIYAK
jgi:2-polyprenyl-3-methyl-5-hydroxy-6-metoxy-1,4-benzoquinol methylase